MNVSVTPYGWADAIQPYLRNTQLFQCPTDTGQPPTSPATTVMGTDPAYTDYFLNRVLQAKPEVKVQYIANTVMLGDALPANARSWSNGCSDLPCAKSEAGQRAVLPGAATRHLRGSNYCFADGHVKWVKGLNPTTCPGITGAIVAPAAQFTALRSSKFLNT